MTNKKRESEIIKINNKKFNFWLIWTISVTLQLIGIKFDMNRIWGVGFGILSTIVYLEVKKII